MNSAAQDQRRRAPGEPALAHDIRVLTADDHQAFRDALRDLISATPGFVLVGQACSGEEAVEAVEAIAPDLVLMDVVMPGIGGVAATRVILNRRPDVTVVLVSIDNPALSDGAGTLSDVVACARKQDLRPAQLRHLWESRSKS
jgi:two-component system, NarL family, invasion response regulator UvrY